MRKTLLFRLYRGLYYTDYKPLQGSHIKQPVKRKVSGPWLFFVAEMDTHMIVGSTPFLGFP